MADKELLKEYNSINEGIVEILYVLARLTVLALILSLTSGCAITNEFGPYKGKVIDAETKEPIEGAVVFMQCFTFVPNLAGSSSYPAGYKEVLTDSGGEFLLQYRPVTLKPGHLWDWTPEIGVFKPGYGVFPGHRNSSSDILVRNTSHILPTNKYVTISLPKLETKELRRENIYNFFYISEVPEKKMENLMYLKDIENIQIGLPPRYTNKERAERGLKLLPESIGKKKAEKIRVKIRPVSPYPPK